MKKTDHKATEAVLDASALLAHVNKERGAHVVSKAIANGAAISIVNWIEVLSKLAFRSRIELVSPWGDVYPLPYLLQIKIGRNKLSPTSRWC